MVCDFGGLAGRTLYLWNARDEYRMKDVPFFCNSHLVMKFVVRGCSSGGAKRHLLQDTTISTDGTSTGVTQDGSTGTDPSGAGAGAGAGTDPGAGGGAGGGSSTGGADGGSSTTGGGGSAGGGVTPGGGDGGNGNVGGGSGAGTNSGQAIDPASFTPRCSPPGTDFTAAAPSRTALDDVSSGWRVAAPTVANATGY